MSDPVYNDAAQRLMTLRKRIIAELMLSPCYQELIRELESRRPAVPYWTPEDDNSMVMQAASAAQKWHDVLMAIIKPKGQE